MTMLILFSYVYFFQSQEGKISKQLAEPREKTNFEDYRDVVFFDGFFIILIRHTEIKTVSDRNKITEIQVFQNDI